MHCLAECEGVRHIFTVPGGTELPLNDALGVAHRNGSICSVHTIHEQGACHMADGYARQTGRPGVVLVTSGPGVLNTVMPMFTAHCDSVPLVCIAGNVPQSLESTRAFQECDIVSAAATLSKRCFKVRSAELLPQVLRDAFHEAQNGLRGAVLVDIPKDV